MSDKKRVYESRQNLKRLSKNSQSPDKGTSDTALAHRDTVLTKQIKLPALADLFRVTLATISDGVIACDPKGIVAFLNPAAQALTGRSEKEACGRSLEKVFPVLNESNREPADIRKIIPLEEDGTGGLPHQRILVAKDGTKRPIEAKINPMPARSRAARRRQSSWFSSFATSPTASMTTEEIAASCFYNLPRAGSGGRFRRRKTIGHRPRRIFPATLLKTFLVETGRGSAPISLRSYLGCRRDFA